MMQRPLAFLLPAFLGLIVMMGMAQSHHFPTPPPSMDPQSNENPKSPEMTRRIDLAQLQRDADDLARTAQTIPTDVASVRRGMLPKDVIDKLKQIEKLSKHLRSELNAR
jgi:hypothetical protein